MRRSTVPIVLFACMCAALAAARVRAAGVEGYYRQPALHGDTLVFVAEGDLWKSTLAGGAATRLTSHPGDESLPAISPDGRTVAFVASYEGSSEVYTMPVSGGLPIRRTWDAARISHVGWTPDGRLLIGTNADSTLPSQQLVLLDLSNGDVAPRRTRVPLAQAAEGSYDAQGTLFFTRLQFQGSHTRRYRGGTAQNLWRFAEGDAEARPLTADYPGTSKRPLWWDQRVYFVTDRDGTMNLWSMNADGGDLREHTRHSGFDVQMPSLSAGRVVYQLGADLWSYDIAANRAARIALTLDSDFDQTRERWIARPMSYLTAAHVSPDGDRVVLTARGEVFVAPARQGRFVQATRTSGVRYRDARFMPDGKSLLALSDESGEVELWTLPANGSGPASQLSTDGDMLRWSALPSPDGKWIAHHDKNQRLWMFNVETRENRQIGQSKIDSFADLAWSPDSRWLAFVETVDNLFRVIRLHNVEESRTLDATTDRFDSYSPAWSPDGKWLYFLSDRNLKTIVFSPWGNYQPEPFMDRTTRLYELALVPGLRSRFAPRDELFDPNEDNAKNNKPAESAPTASTAPATASVPASTSSPATDSAPASASAPASQPPAKPTVRVTIEAEGLATRLYEVPVPAGNYGGLSVTESALYWLTLPIGPGRTSLTAINIARENVEVKTVAGEINSYELSADGKKILIRKGDNLYVVDASPAPADLDKKVVDLSAWRMTITPREEWRQMFDEAWRLERDYFYDRGMHGVDWQALRAKFRPLVDRVSTRAELSDLIAQLVSELAALHIFVSGGDMREGPEQAPVASLGATLERDAAAGGWRVAHIFQSDPDEPERTAPLARSGVDVRVGDVIEQINGVDTLNVPDLGYLLRHQAGRQVLLRIRPAGGESREAIAVPISSGAAADLRYHEWEYTRRKLVEEWSDGQIGYVHLRAMGADNWTESAKGYYPVFNRAGLIIDVRHNRGGNIDSWILGRLMRKAWFYWSQRVGQQPLWNMQYAFRGHMAALCNEFTASDGEAFSEGFKRLGLGKLFGTRTWGGEIWLSSNGFLRDGGIATAAEYGRFGPEGVWLIEGHGVDPDVVVDNLPHATFKGEDAQLRAAVDHLMKEIREKPIPPVQAPRHPDKSFQYPPTP